MNPKDQRNDACQHIILANVLRRQGLAIDETQDEGPWFRINNFRGHSSLEGGLTCRLFVESHDAVYRNVLTDAYNEPVTPIRDYEIGIRDAAAQGFRCDRSFPARKLRGLLEFQFRF
jgi:hypothetical protein